MRKKYLLILILALSSYVPIRAHTADDIFFDDFEDGTIDTSIWSISGSVTESDGYLIIGPNSKISSTSSFGHIILEFEMKAPNGDRNNRLEGAGFRDPHDKNNIIFYDYNSNEATICIGTKFNNFWSPIDFIPCFDRSEWQKYKIERYSNIVKFYQNDILLSKKMNHIPNLDLQLEFASKGDFIIYLDNVKVYTYTPTEEPQQGYVIIDQNYVSDHRTDVGKTETIGFHAKWYNGTNVVNCTISVDGRNYTTDSSGWISFHYDMKEVGSKSWKVTSVNCNGISGFIQTTPDPTIIWDQVQIILSLADDRIDVDKSAMLTWIGTYLFDNSEFQGDVDLKYPTLEQEIGKSTFTVSSILDQEYGLNSFVSNSVSCLWDRIKIVDGGVSRNETAMRMTETIWFKAVYEYDNEVFDGSKGILYINDEPLDFSFENDRWEKNVISNEPDTRVFKVTGVKDDKYGLSFFNDIVSPQAIQWVENNIMVIEGGTSKQKARIGDTETVWFKAVYEYDEEEFTGQEGKLYVNNEPLTWSSHDRQWKYGTTLEGPGNIVFEITSVDDNRYSLTIIDDKVGPLTITWERPFWETTVGIISIGGVIVVLVAASTFFLRKRI